MRNQKVVMVLCVSTLVACGASGGGGGGGTTEGSWAGTYTGPLTSSGTCSDGSPFPSTPESSSLTITQSGSTISWMASCGATAVADVSGNTATIRQYSCPSQMSGSNTVQFTVTGGVLTLSGNSLSANIVARATIAGATTGSCNISVTGTLARR